MLLFGARPKDYEMISELSQNFSQSQIEYKSNIKIKICNWQFWLCFQSRNIKKVYDFWQKFKIAEYGPEN